MMILLIYHGHDGGGGGDGHGHGHGDGHGDHWKPFDYCLKRVLPWERVFGLFVFKGNWMRG